MPESNKNEPTCAFVHVLTNIHPYIAKVLDYNGVYSQGLSSDVKVNHFPGGNSH